MKKYLTAALLRATQRDSWMKLAGEAGQKFDGTAQHSTTIALPPGGPSL